MKLNKLIDHTLLKPSATRKDIEKLCEEAIQYGFYSVCINGSFVSLAKNLLSGSDVKICTVVGFPLGAMSTAAKVFETEQALRDGTDEIDMVMHVGLLKSGAYEEVLNDIRSVKKACGKNCLKVILEISELKPDEIQKACEISVLAGADFVKTSTGFGSGGATMEAVKIMKNTAGSNARIKASGGIRDYETAMKYVELGVDRLGVSAGVAIVSGKSSKEEY